MGRKERKWEKIKRQWVEKRIWEERTKEKKKKWENVMAEMGGEKDKLGI